MQSLDIAGITANFGKPGLTAGGSAGQYTTGAAFPFAVRGLSYNRTALTDQSTPATDANTGAAFLPIPAGSASACWGCVYVWCVNTAGTVSLVQGTIAPTTIAASGANTTFLTLPQMPNIPANVCPFAYTVVRVGSSGAAFNVATAALSTASNIFVAHQDIATLPDRPKP